MQKNRLSGISKINGTDCDNLGTAAIGGVCSANSEANACVRSTTRLFLFGGSVEVEDNGTTVTTTKYYSIAGMRVAMYDDSGVHYFAADHLSSASVIMDSTGALLSQNRYLPFGEVRQISELTNITETDFGFTGQRAYQGFGLMDYHARFYSPSLGRFTQPDTIIPQLDQSIAWNRYVYANNNPIIYIDPTGHSVVLTLLALAGAGAAIGAAVQTGYQIYEQWDKDQSLLENVKSTKYDVAKIGGAAAGGAAFGVLSTVATAGLLATGVVGATTSLGAAITTVASGGGGFLPSVFGGLVGGAASTPFSAITESAIEQKSTTGSVNGFWQSAVNSGSLDPNEWATKGFSGGIAGGLGYLGGKIISDITWVPTSISGTPWPVTTQGYGESGFSFALRQFTNSLKSSTRYSTMLNTSFEMLNEVLQNESQETIDDILQTPLPQ